MIKRLQREFQQCNGKIEGVTVELGDNNDLTHWTLRIQAPAGCPYEGGIITVKVTFPEKYPHKEPIVIFTPPLYHPGVAQNKPDETEPGRPCMEILNKWSPNATMEKTVIPQLIEFISKPYEGHEVDPEIMELVKTNRQEFDRKAREWTAQNAK